MSSHDDKADKPLINDGFERLLYLIPYLAQRPGITFSEIAQDFQVKPKKIESDLRRLWVDCGLPGGYGGDLIDFNFYGNQVDLVFSAGLDRPLRLTGEEATALIIALDALLYYDNLCDPIIIARVREKIEKSAKIKKIRGNEIPREDINLPLTHSRGTYTYIDIKSKIIQALVADKVLDMHYYSSTSDKCSSRMVDPIRIFSLGKEDYLLAWCRRSEEIRYFRFDRIDALRISDQPRLRRQTTDSELNTYMNFRSIFNSSIKMRVYFKARWCIEHYSLTILEELPDNSAIVDIEYISSDWLMRLIMSLSGYVELLDNNHRKEHESEYNSCPSAKKLSRSDIYQFAQSALDRYKLV